MAEGCRDREAEVLGEGESVGVRDSSALAEAVAVAQAVVLPVPTPTPPAAGAAPPDMLALTEVLLHTVAVLLPPAAEAVGLLCVPVGEGGAEAQ